MKILRVIGSMDPALGGVTEAVRLTSVAMRELGVETEVLSVDPPGSALTPEPPIIHRTGPMRSPWAYSRDLLPWLKENASRYDAVIVDGLWQYPAYAVHEAWMRGALPHYWVFTHGMLDPWFQSLSRRPIKTIRNAIYWRLAERKTINDAAGLLFTCEEERRLAATAFPGYAPKAEHVVGLGTTRPPAFAPSMAEAFREKCSCLTDRPYLLFLSRLHPKKGADLLIEAYAQANQDHSLPWDLVLAGPPHDPAFSERLRKAAEGVPGRIHFPGMLTGDAKWGAFYGCDAFVLPSHQENFGIVVAEALACGKPVLATRQVNIWREIEKAPAGLFAEDTLPGIRSLLESFRTYDTTQLEALRVAALPCYNQEFAIEQAAERLLGVLFGHVHTDSESRRAGP